MNRYLRLFSFRYLLHHPWHTVLSIIGIALGVSLVMAIDLANQSAKTAFELSMEKVTGRATHQVIGGSDGIPDSIYTRLRIKGGFRQSAPVVEGYARTMDEPAMTFRLLGVDVFAEQEFRPFLADIGDAAGGMGNFIGDSLAVAISAGAAEQLNLTAGDTLKIRCGPHPRLVKIAAILQPDDANDRQALNDLMIADIATAQHLLDMYGQLSRIDLLLPDGQEEPQESVSNIKMLVPNMRVESAATRSQATVQMVRAFDINLTALSMLALIVGMFLIYNTITFSVVQRRRQIAILRAIGVTRKEVFFSITTEALLLGSAGTALGITLGLLLGSSLVQLVSQTINDLYFVVSVREMQVEAFSLLKAVALGIGATILAAAKPATEATGIPPRQAMSRSTQESRLRDTTKKRAALGLLLLIIGAVILWWPDVSIVISYAGILPVIIGFTLMVPAAIQFFITLLTPINGLFFGLMGRIASRDIAAHLSRTSVAIAALSIAVAATIGVGSMINSFRGTVVHWLESRLQADVYISPPTLLSRRNQALLDSAFSHAVLQLPQISDYNYFRENFFYLPDGVLHLLAIKSSQTSRNNILFKSGERENIWPAIDDHEAILVSEPYAFRNKVSVGDSVLLPTDFGPRTFAIAGVYYDYGSDIGVVTMAFETYQRHWRDHRLSGISLYLQPNYATDQAIADVQRLAGERRIVLARSNSFLRDTSIEVFDRTFLISRVLHLLSIGVAFVGVLSALMSLQMERARELAILRTSGLTPSQLWRLMMLQTGGMGLLSGLLALPLGNILALILIYVINQRSFGWTLQYQFLPDIHIQAIIIAVVAALLAGIYPALKMSATPPAVALREE